MKEIITIQLGNCGNSVGNAFWDILAFEHGLESNGLYCGKHELELYQIDSMFTMGASGRNYVPRCVLVDLDPGTLESVRCSPVGQLFRPDNFIAGPSGSGNNFAKGYMTSKVHIKDFASEAIRKEMEFCDRPVGFQIFGALGGGTGSGMGALLLEQLKDEYPKVILANYSVIPGGFSTASDAVVEPINSILACPSLVKYSDFVTCFDNQSLHDVCLKTLKLDSPTYQDLNQLISQVIAGMTATYRFPARMHVGWRTLKCVMVPCPKLHFFVPGYAPVNSRGVQAYRTFSVQDITYQILQSQNVLMAPGIRSGTVKDGKYIAAATYYRGFSVHDDPVTDQLSSFVQKYPSQFVEWLPYQFLKGISEIPPKGSKIACTFLANHSGAQREIWSSLLKKFNGMFKRKAFLHWFYGEGMNEDDLRTAAEDVHNLVAHYKRCETEMPPDYAPDDEDLLKIRKCIDEEIFVRLKNAYSASTTSNLWCIDGCCKIVNEFPDLKAYNSIEDFNPKPKFQLPNPKLTMP